MNQPKALSTAEAAHELGVSIKTVQQWMEKGLLSGWKTPGGHRRVRLDEVRQLAEERQRAKRNSIGNICKVLVIEDDPDICRLYDIMSRTWRTPTEMHFAHDGMAGLIALGKLVPDFVVVDLNIPKVDGYQLIQSLHQQFDPQALRYCVVTGLSKDDIEERGKLPDRCRILSKPIDFVTLEQWIATAFSEVTARTA